jgi:YggT family protein
MGAIITVVYYALTIYELILLARVLLTWFPNIDRSNPLIQLVFDLTEPVLRPIRDLLPQNMMIDFSPLIVFLIINVLLTFLR